MRRAGAMQTGQLTKKGRDEILAVAHWMKGQDLHFDLIATSPFARAQETAAIVADVLGPERTCGPGKHSHRAGTRIPSAGRSAAR